MPPNFPITALIVQVPQHYSTCLATVPGIRYLLRGFTEKKQALRHHRYLYRLIRHRAWPNLLDKRLYFAGSTICT